MKIKIIVKWMLKFISAVITFLLILMPVQSFFVPENDQDKTVKSLYYLPENSVDVLFMGSSQLFCSIDAQKMTDEYKISSCDFSAGSQNFTTTVYYLEEALKMQRPKVVVVEVCSIFYHSTDPLALSCSYYPMPMSIDKFKSVDAVFDGDKTEAFKYTYSPLLLCHDRWKSMSVNDIKEFFNNNDMFSNHQRGFYPRNANVIDKIAFYNEKGEKKTIPEKNVSAISDIKKICEKNNIDLLFFKAPSAEWTKTDSEIVKTFMKKHSNVFIDFNEYLSEIGIDKKTDFNNETHLSLSGAEKTTDYMAKLLQTHLDQ